MTGNRNNRGSSNVFYPNVTIIYDALALSSLENTHLPLIFKMNYLLQVLDIYPNYCLWNASLESLHDLLSSCCLKQCFASFTGASTAVS